MKNNQGQSLVEMVIAIGVMLVILVALVGLTTISMRNVSFSRNQALATKYAQESLEEARQLRDRQGESFFVNNSCSQIDQVGVFERQRDCYLNSDNPLDSDKMTVTVTVSWSDAQGTHQSKLTTDLTKWR